MRLGGCASSASLRERYVNSHVMAEPHEFHGRRSHRILNGVCLVLFGAILLVAVVMPFFSPERGWLFFGSMAVLSLAVIGGAWLQMLRAFLIAGSTVRLTAEGLTLTHALGARSVPWDLMLDYTRREVAANGISIRVRGEKPLILDLGSVVDGAELGRSIRFRLAPIESATAAELSFPQTMRPRNVRRILAGLIVFSLFPLMLLTVLFTAVDHGPRYWGILFQSLFVLLLVLLLVELSLPGLTSFVTIFSDRIETGNLFRRTSMTLSAVTSITDELRT